MKRNKSKKYHKSLRKSKSLDMVGAVQNVSAKLTESSPFEIATTHVVAPTLTFYVMWLLKQAQENNHKKLYFLTRDGKILCDIANKFVKKFNLDIECRILYSSRYAWRMASYFMDENFIDTISIPSLNFTTRKLLHRVLDDEEMEEVAKEIQQSTLDSVLNSEDLDYLKDLLENCDLFKDIVKEKSEKAYKKCISYFKQEGLFDNEEVVVIDSGWIGSTTKTLKQLISTVNSNIEVKTYLFGVYYYHEGVNPENITSYYFDNISGRKEKVSFNSNLFECFCSDSSGMTIGYKEVNEKFVPITKNSRNRDFEKIDYQQELILDFVTELLKLTEEFKLEPSDIKIIRSLYKKFMTNPSLEEAEEFGNYEFNDDIVANTEYDLAPMMTFWEILRYGAIGKFFHKIGFANRSVPSCFWPYASIVKSNVPFKRFLRFNVKILYNIKYRIYKNR